MLLIDPARKWRPNRSGSRRPSKERKPNVTEYAFEQLLKENGVSFSRRGYPDYTIIKNGRIVGFVEVKQWRRDRLRDGQRLFSRLCEDYGIPFARWSPEEPFPDWLY